MFKPSTITHWRNFFHTLWWVRSAIHLARQIRSSWWLLIIEIDKDGNTFLLKVQRSLSSKQIFSIYYLVEFLLGCPASPVINSVFGRLCRKTASRGREDTRVWYRETMFSQVVSYSGRKNVMSMRELFCPDPQAGFEKMAGFQMFYCLKIKCFHSQPGKNRQFAFKSCKLWL